MKICFVLPKFSRLPIGGYKIVFEYANRLDAEGHKVFIVFKNDDSLASYRLPKWIKKIIANILTSAGPKWFSLNNAITWLSSTQQGSLRKVEDSDVVFATGIQTVEMVKKNFHKAKKLYLIQGYENWGISEEYLWGSYRCGFTNIVVSNWLKDIVEKYTDQKACLIKNPIDCNLYQCRVRQNDRKPHVLGLLYHTHPLKGLQYAFEAIYKLKERYEDLEVEMFGAHPKPENLPDWIHYSRSLSQSQTVDLYNKVQVFLCASVEEGFGLTGLEAIACGACLVSTAYTGVLEYAENEYNALLSPVKDVDMLVANVSRLFDNEEERIRIAANGIESVKKYSWDVAMQRLNEILSE